MRKFMSVISAVAVLLLILGIINAFLKVPIETTYRVSRWGSETFEYTCKLGNNYEYKYTVNGKIVSNCTGKYSVDGDIITFYKVNTFGDQFNHNETINIAETPGSSWLTPTLCGVGGGLLVLDFIAFTIYRHQKPRDSED